MADLLDRIAQQDKIDTNREVAAANRDYQWARTFKSTPTAEVLRSRLNLADVVDRAATNKMQLEARTSGKALDLLRKTAEFDEWRQQAPLREEKLKADIYSKGAATRFAERKDTEVQNDLAGFYNYMDRAPKVTDPGYQSYLNQGISKYPRIIGTDAGRDTLKRLQQEHADVLAIVPPPGQEIAKYTFDDSGRIRAETRPIPAPVTPTSVPEGMVPLGATEDKKGDVSVRYGVPKEQQPVKPLTGKSDTFKQFNTELEEMVKAYGGADKVPADRWAEFEAKKATIGKGTPAVAAQPSGPAKITNKEEYSSLPSGSEFIDPNGVRRRKP